MGAPATLSEQIVLGSKNGNKTYTFNEGHDRTRPTRWWFQQSKDGLILFVVFYSQACRWSRCMGCNLPSTCSQFHVSYKDLIKQIDFLFADADVAQRRTDIHKVIVSNNGSVLDQETFSSTALIYLVAQLNLHLPNLSVLSVETRPDYVDLPELEFLSRAMKEGDTPTRLELAIGFEAFDDAIRNKVYKKGLTKTTFENLVAALSPYGFGLKCYFMQKPVPGMTDEEAVLDIQNAIQYLAAVSDAHQRQVAISMHLNPTYAAYGTMLGQAFLAGQYQPPSLLDVARAVLEAENKAMEIFIGLSDEGLAVPKGSFLSNGSQRFVAPLQLFNTMQDYGILRSIIAN